MIDQSAYLDQPYILNVQAAAAGLRPGEGLRRRRPA